MHQSAIEKSELTVAHILHKLLQRGVQGGGLRYSDLGAMEGLATHFIPCAQWLKSEGIIRFSSVKDNPWKDGGSILIEPTLTAKGFAMMGTTFGGFDQAGPSKLGSEEEPRLADAVEQVSMSNQGYARAGNFVGGLLGAFSKSVS